MKKTILFVCNGNIYRSAIAEVIFDTILKEFHLNEIYMASSCGLQGSMGTPPPKHQKLSEYPDEWHAAKPTLDRLNIDVSKCHFHPITEQIIKQADVVIAMDDYVYKQALNSLLRQFPDYISKMHLFSEFTSDHKEIEDPSGVSLSSTHQMTIEHIFNTLHEKYNEIIRLS